MAFPAFLDTCVLFGQAQCDVLLSLAHRGLFVPYWSEDVLGAVARNVVGAGHTTPEQIGRRIDQMKRAFPQAMVTGYEQLIPAMTNHPGDRHVLAACICSPAQTLVTANVKDFPDAAVQPFEIEVKHPDDFPCDLLDLFPEETLAGVGDMLARNQRPPRDYAQLAEWLARADAPRFGAQLLRRA